MPDLIIPDHFTTQFDKNWKMLAGQKNARLMGKSLFETGCTGEKKTHNQVGDLDSIETTGERYKQIPLRDLATAKRWVTPRQFSNPTAADKWDEKGLLPTIAPNGMHTMTHARAYGRDMDDVFISALGGTAYTGADGTTATALPSGSKVAKDFTYDGTSTDSSLVPQKIVQALRILADNDAIDDDELSEEQELFGIMTPTCEQFLRLCVNGEVSGVGKNLFSKDYVPPVLDDRGRIKRWLGINWTVTTRPGLVDTTDTSLHYAYVWTKSGMQFDVWEGMTTTIDRLPQSNNAIMFLSQYSFGATRLEEEKVIQITADTDA